MSDGWRWRPPFLLVSALLDWNLDTLCLGNLLAVGGLVTIAIGGGGGGGEADGGAGGPAPGLTLLGGNNTTLVTGN